MDKRIHIVAIGPVRHDGVAYADGEVIADVPIKQAEALLQVGAARLADVEPTNDAHPADDAGGDHRCVAQDRCAGAKGVAAGGGHPG